MSDLSAKETSSIYIHIPFCSQACHYCSFYFTVSQHRKQEFLKALKHEIISRANEAKDNKIFTIYIGGGTPTVLSADEIKSIYLTILSHYTIDEENLEFTIESNPEHLSIDYLDSLKKIGINRLSIGIQSFDELDLSTMNRSHTAVQANDAIENATTIFDNVSLDLMFGLPYADMSIWKDNINKALAYDVNHISTYNLTVEEKTSLHKKVQQKKIKLVPDDTLNEMYYFTMETMMNAGYIHYEISNFSKPNYESQHNKNYWQQGKYLGFGPSAHSYSGLVRRSNVSNLKHYIDGIENDTSYFEIETLTQDNLYNEFVLTRLRTIDGIKLNELNTLFGSKFAQDFKQTAEIYLTQGTIVLDQKAYKLTSKGKPIADNITLQFMKV